MFRGKESSNRIELSRLDQDLLNFGVLGSLQLLGWGNGGGWGVLPTHVHTHACTCTHPHIHVKHDNFNCKWQPPLGESLGIPYDVIHARVHVHACMCLHVHVCGGTPHPHPPTPHPQGGPPESVKI